MTLKGVHPRTIRWLDTLPSTGRLMRDLGRCRHVYTKGWNISSTRTNHILRCGSRYTIKTPSSTIMQPFTGSQQTANPPRRLPHITKHSGIHDLVEHLLTKYLLLVGGAIGDDQWQHWQENTSRRQIYSVLTAQTWMSLANMGEIHCIAQLILEISRWSGY